MTDRIDVIAAMRDAEDRLQASYSDSNIDASYALYQARAAVAELIESATDLAKAVSEETAFLAANHFRAIAECDEHKKFENRVIQATERLAAALARIGDAA